MSADLGVPDGVLVKARGPPGDLIAAGRRLRPNRHPRAKFEIGRASCRETELRAGRPPNRKQKIVVRDLNQAGRSLRLDHRRESTGHAVAIEVLVETGFV